MVSFACVCCTETLVLCWDNFMTNYKFSVVLFLFNKNITLTMRVLNESLWYEKTSLWLRPTLSQLSLESPGQHWGCRADGGRVQCWRWCLHTHADRPWWSLWSPAGSSVTAVPSGPSPSIPSRYRSSSGTQTACTPVNNANSAWMTRRAGPIYHEWTSFPHYFFI